MFMDVKTRQINIKIVYEGPMLCGKSTCLENIYKKVRPEHRSPLHRFPHCGIGERMMFFDFIPRSLPPIRGFQIHLHFYTVTGTDVYASSHRDLMKGADALMFVADSQRSLSGANVELRELVEMLLAEGVAARPQIPWLFSYNKRDLPDALPIEELAAQLNPGERHPSVATIATRGEGVFEAMKALVSLRVAELRAKLEAPASGA